jgi:prepilin-type N-terminal cleavage/methylation domain-containing protein
MHTRKGFTLVELLIVVVVIGILATIAIPKFSAMRAKSFVAAVTSDLKNLATHQELYLSTEHTYALTVADLGMTLSDEVDIDINEATGVGWAAVGTHSGLGGQECGIYYGTADPANAGPADAPGTVICD